MLTISLQIVNHIGSIQFDEVKGRKGFSHPFDVQVKQVDELVISNITSRHKQQLPGLSRQQKRFYKVSVLGNDNVFFRSW